MCTSGGAIAWILLILTIYFHSGKHDKPPPSKRPPRKANWTRLSCPPFTRYPLDFGARGVLLGDTLAVSSLLFVEVALAAPLCHVCQHGDTAKTLA